jgi:hypothetical protein
VGETNFMHQGTSVVSIDIAADVLDRMVRTALRRRGGCGPISRFVGNAPLRSYETSDRSAARGRTALIRWIVDEVRRWSRSPLSRERDLDPGSVQRPRRRSDSFSSN